MIMGLEKPDAGEFVVGDTVKLAYVDQNRFAPEDKRNVWECISGGAEILKLGNREINSRAYVAGFNFTGSYQQNTVNIL